MQADSNSSERSPGRSPQSSRLKSGEPPPLLLISTDSYFYMVARFPRLVASFMKINRETGKITMLTEQLFSTEISYTPEKKTKDYWQLLVGVLIVNQEPYLCGVSKTEAVATLDNEPIYCIKQFRCIPFKHSCLYLVINQSENAKILEYISSEVIKDNFYFCYNRDLTLTCQKIYQKRSTERKYFWNEHMLTSFISQQIPKCWRIPILQGHIQELFSKTKYFTFYYCLVSRRSKYMSGTRFYSRGVDDNFNAANFVETEEVFVCQNFIFTHVAVRGSVPIFWEQEGFGAPVKFSHTDQQNMLVLQKHFELLKKEYQSYVIAINLLSQKKEAEKDLTNRYKYYLYKTIPSEPYIHYDLNESIKNKQKSMNEIIDRFIDEHLDKFAPNENFFCIDRETGKLYSQQSILPRLNCLDCLDRSNVIMSRISLVFIKQVEIFINSHTNMVEKKINLTKDYKEQVIKLWAQLGNRISLIYSGTESTATHLTKQEQSSFFSFLSETFNSASRYFQSNLKDEFKQTCLDFLLGQKEELSRTTYFEDNIMTKIIKEHEYCDYEELIIYTLTWNCNMVDPYKLAPRELDKLFNFPIEKTDLVVVCLQEMVELSGFNVVFGGDQTINSDWEKVIMKYLNEKSHQFGRSFAMLASYSMVGLATFVFTCGTVYNRVGKTMWHQVKTGFNNNLGNKGAIILFLQIDDSFITFMNCHLAAGQKESGLRMQAIDYIHNQALNERFKRRLFDKSEFKFFIGDLNFRLQAKNQEVRELLYTIQKQDAQKKLTKSQMESSLSILLQKDEFRLNKNFRALSMYNEATIYFMPTYKYVKKEKKYDLKRTPSWCDRILFNSSEPEKLAVLKYWDIQCYQSDHKPVCGAFKILVKIQNKDLKKKLMQKYMQKSQ